ncbi:MAG: O-antigen ligase family protein [Myxococcales bacterium]
MISRSDSLQGMWRLVVVTALLAVLTLAAIILAGGDIAAAIAPVGICAVLCLLWTAPLRVALLLLAFFAPVLDGPRLAGGKVTPPTFALGNLLLENLNKTVGISALSFTGLDCLTAFLILVAVLRRATGSRVDREGQIETAWPLAVAGMISLAGTGFEWAYGVSRGGSTQDSLWQVQKIAYVPILFFLFQAAVRGPSDSKRLLRGIVWAALIRAGAAVYIAATFPVPPGGELAVATTHADSVVFASAFAIVLASLWEGEVPGHSVRSWLALAVLAAGMAANNRRLVWVEVIGIVVTYALLSRRTRFQRNLIRALILMLPLLVPYVAVGWHSDAGIFKPVRVIRSITDSDSDGSTKWRDFENWNLVYTVADHPLLGSGFGHEYVERWKLPDISGSYKQYRYMPHNSVLGLWASVGVVGFCLIWTQVVAGVFLAARCYRFAHTPAHKALALAALGIIVAYVNQCYGDIGINAWAGVFMLVPALVSVGKLAVVTGAWPARRRRTIAVPFAKAAPEMAA